MEALEGLTDQPVHPGPPLRRQPVVERLPHQAVREAEATRRLDALGDHAEEERQLEQVESALVVDAGRRGEQAEVELPTYHRGHAEQGHSFLGEAGEPDSNGIPDSGRDVPGCQLRVGPFAMAAGPEQRDELGDEEGIAFGPGPDGLGQSRAGRAAGRLLDEGGDLGLGEPPGDEAHEPGLATEVAQRAHHGRGGLGLDLPVGADHQHGGRPDPRADHLQELQGGHVGGMQVVDHQHHRLGTRKSPHEGVDRGEQQATGRFRLHQRHRGQIDAGDVLDLGDELCDLGRTAGERGADQVGVGGAHQRPEHLVPRPEGWSGLGLVAVPPGHQRAPGRRPSAELVGQAGLADARLTRQEHDPARSGGDVVQRRVEPGQLRVAPDEEAPRRGRVLRRGRRLGAGHERVDRRGGRALVRRWLPVEGRRLEQDVVFQPPQRRARLQAELFDEGGPGPVQGPEGVGLAAAAVVRQGQQLPAPLAERIGHDEPFEVEQGGGVVAQRQLHLGQRLRGRRPELDQAGSLGLDERLEGQIGVGGALPEGQPAPQRGPGRFRPTPRQIGQAGAGHGLETGGVDGVGRRPQDVPGRVGHQHLRGRARRPAGLEGTPEPGHVALHRRGGGRRRLVAPQLVDEPVQRHHPVDVHDQEGEDRPGHPRPEVQRTAVYERLHRAEDPELHAAASHRTAMLRGLRPASDPGGQRSPASTSAPSSASAWSRATALAFDSRRILANSRITGTNDTATMSPMIGSRYLSMSGMVLPRT